MSKLYSSVVRKFATGMIKIHSLFVIRALLFTGVLAVSLSGCTKETDKSTGTPKPATAKDCTPGYKPCLPPMSDYDCKGGQGDGPGYTDRVEVTGSDPYDLDRDGDGFGC
jgi:hypothetical protein